MKKRKRFVIHIRSVLTKLARDLSLDPCDLDYALRRLHKEGPAFVTKTLPAFSKYVLHCCEKQQWLNAPSVGLTNFAVKRNFPIFMRGLFIKAVIGCADALYRIRQFCEYFYKTCFDFQKKTLAKFEEKYVSTDQEYSRERIDWGKVEVIRKRIQSYFPSLFTLVPSDVYELVRPHDGPGAFALSDVITKYSKFSIWEYKKLPGTRIGTCMQAQSPFSGYFKGYPSSPERITIREDHTVAELRFVPKDSRGPRVISKEPLLLLRAQMSAGKAIAKVLEGDSGGHINFTDQTVNRELALESSKTRERATVDLKEASDRVWLAVVRHISRFCPVLRYAITLRSTHVRLPNGRVIRLNKLANMGSGICFPFLALMVYATSVTALVEDRGYSINDAMSLINVYGDDLICPKNDLPAIKKWLESVGLVINSDKSYSSGFFRESCGGDYYHGVEVAPIRLRLSNEGLDPVESYRNGSFPVTTAAGLNQIDRHCRELRLAGLNRLADHYYDRLRARLGPLPYVAIDSPFLGIFDPSKIVRGFPQKGYLVTVAKTVSDELCPYKGLGQSFASRDGLMQDWSLTPLRRSVLFKRRVPEFSELACFGRTEALEEVFPNWGDRSFYVATNLVTKES